MSRPSKHTLLIAIASIALFWSQSALACGGFFCSNFPIAQAGEKIVFELDEETVTAIIQIQFTGDAEDFSWVLPLPSEPMNDGGMEISSEELFVQLLARTSPTFTIEWSNVDSCQPYWNGNDFDFASELADDSGGGGGNVQVLQVKEVGPYTASVVKSDDAEALSAWLDENDYTQPPEATPLIAHYVAQGNVFLALKLQQNKGSGDIAPIKVTFNEPEGACIPLILTAIAATDDMPVYAWILDESRVVPKNFFNVGINMAKISWVDGGENYLELVTEAVNEAAGHGFTTEYAGTSTIMKGALYWDGRFDNVDALAEYTHPRDFYSAFSNSGLPSNAQTLGLLEQFIPVPDYFEGDSMNFYNEVPWNADHDEYLDNLDFDAAAAVEKIKEVIVQPIMDAQDLLDNSPYMTRIFTTISPDEMNRDPIFVASSSLGDVSHAHVATGTGTCDTGENGQQISNVILTLEDGTVINYDGEWPLWEAPEEAAGTTDGELVSDQPSASSIARLMEDGSLEEVPADLVEYEDQQMGFAESGIGNSSSPTPGSNSGVDGDVPQLTAPTAGSSVRGSGCRTSSGNRPFWAVIILTLLSGFIFLWVLRGNPKSLQSIWKKENK